MDWFCGNHWFVWWKTPTAAPHDLADPVAVASLAGSYRAGPGRNLFFRSRMGAVDWRHHSSGSCTSGHFGFLTTFRMQRPRGGFMNASVSTYTADIILTPPLAVNSFVPAVTPGNVAVCLSGGGSRAMTAGMGQLLALENVLSGNASLLSQTKMLSTV